MAFEVVLPARQGGLQRRRLVATAVIVAAGLVAAVVMRRGAGAASEAQGESWEARSSGSVRFWNLGITENGIPKSMDSKALSLYKDGLINRQELLKQTNIEKQAGILKSGLRMTVLQSKNSEDEPPFIGADIAGAMGNGRVSGGSTKDYYEPFPTQDYGFWGTAMSFPQHDSVARRVRDMVDDEGKPLETNEYQAGAKSKSFIQPLLEVPSDYGKLDYDDGKEGMYKYVR